MKELYVINGDGSDMKRLTYFGKYAEAPSWSPSGRQIAFSMFNEIHLVAADGSALRRLTTGRDPAWSADGRSIVFSDNREFGCYSFSDVCVNTSELYSIPAEGGEPTPLTHDPGVDFRATDSAPDGSGFVAACRSRPVADVCRIHPDGSFSTVVSSAGGDPRPVVSPDGRGIAYSRGGYPGRFEIATFSPEDGRARTVARGRDPDWQPRRSTAGRPPWIDPVWVVTRSARLSSSGRIRIRLACTRAQPVCRGVVQLSTQSPRRPLARRGFRIARGRSPSVVVRLPGSRAQALRRDAPEWLVVSVKGRRDRFLIRFVPRSRRT